MVPFMAGQSFAMGEAFGKGFQYGKRRVSSMTNEQFNASSAESMFKETTADITKMIPAMKNAMSEFSTLQTDIILEMVKYIAQLPKDVIPTIAPIIGDVASDLPNVLFDTILKQLGILNPIPQAEARLSQPDIKAKYDALIFAIENKKSQDFIASLTWGLHLALKTVTPIVGVGPVIPPGITPAPPPPSNTLILDEDGNVISTNDTRIPKPKLDPPTSIVTKWKKLHEEIKSLNNILKKLRARLAPPAEITKYLKIKDSVIREINELELKYNL